MIHEFYCFRLSRQPEVLATCPRAPAGGHSCGDPPASSRETFHHWLRPRFAPPTPSFPSQSIGMISSSPDHLRTFTLLILLLFPLHDPFYQWSVLCVLRCKAYFLQVQLEEVLKFCSHFSCHALLVHDGPHPRLTIRALPVSRLSAKYAPVVFLQLKF